MRRKVTSRFRRTDMFSRRIVITVSRSGVVTIVMAIFIAAWKLPQLVTNSVALVLSIVALATIVEARHQLRTFRYEMRERIAAQLEDWDIPDDLPDLRETEDAPARVIRLPGN